MKALTRFALPCLLLALVVSAGCSSSSSNVGGGSGGTPGQMNYSGTYSVTGYCHETQETETATMTITQVGNSVTAVVVSPEEHSSQSLQGTVDGNTMTLTGPAGDYGTVTFTLTFADNGQTFTGTGTEVSDATYTYTISGTKIS